MAIDEFPNTGECEFISFAPGEQLNWVLAIDDAAKKCALPGRQP